MIIEITISFNDAQEAKDYSRNNTYVVSTDKGNVLEQMNITDLQSRLAFLNETYEISDVHVRLLSI